MPLPKALLSKLAAFDRAERLLRPRDRVLAAVSGGPDSVCLAHRLAWLAPRRGLRVSVLHMHHGLRGLEADRDAGSVRRLCLRLGLPFVLRRLPVAAAAQAERRSLEDAGRALRYRTLAAEARRLGCNKVATGHQLDDHAETLLLHLLRGTKVKGLAGIPPRRPLQGAAGVEVVRPLLCLTRAEVRRYLKAFGVPSREDRTNRSEEFTRNWVRRKLLPVLEQRNPRIREHLMVLAREVRRLLDG